MKIIIWGSDNGRIQITEVRIAEDALCIDTNTDHITPAHASACRVIIKHTNNSRIIVFITTCI